VLLIVINAAVFAYEISLDSLALGQFVNTYGLVPVRVLDGNSAGLSGLVTAMFIHAGWFHILSNLWFLLLFGSVLEGWLGPVRYLTMYLLGGIAAGLMQVIVAPDLQLPVIGASGALAAVMGVYLLFFPGSRVLSIVFLFLIPIVFEISAVLYLLFWFVSQFANGLLSLGTIAELGGIAYWTHIGGFLFGLISAPFFGLQQRPQPVPAKSREIVFR
jgi:membrane associated rhomboid family serine protease